MSIFVTMSSQDSSGRGRWCYGVVGQEGSYTDVLSKYVDNNQSDERCRDDECIFRLFFIAWCWFWSRTTIKVRAVEVIVRRGPTVLNFDCRIMCRQSRAGIPNWSRISEKHQFRNNLSTVSFLYIYRSLLARYSTQPHYVGLHYIFFVFRRSFHPTTLTNNSEVFETVIDRTTTSWNHPFILNTQNGKERYFPYLLLQFKNYWQIYPQLNHEQWPSASSPWPWPASTEQWSDREPIVHWVCSNTTPWCGKRSSSWRLPRAERRSDTPYCTILAGWSRSRGVWTYDTLEKRRRELHSVSIFVGVLCVWLFWCCFFLRSCIGRWMICYSFFSYFSLLVLYLNGLNTVSICLNKATFRHSWKQWTLNVLSLHSASWLIGSSPGLYGKQDCARRRFIQRTISWAYECRILGPDRRQMYQDPVWEEPRQTMLESWGGPQAVHIFQQDFPRLKTGLLGPLSGMVSNPTSPWHVVSCHGLFHVSASSPRLLGLNEPLAVPRIVSCLCPLDYPLFRRAYRADHPFWERRFSHCHQRWRAGYWCQSVLAAPKEDDRQTISWPHWISAFL